MNELFENPILIGLIGGIVVVFCGYIGIRSGRKTPFVFAAIGAFLTLALLLLAFSIETDREQIHSALFQLEKAIQANDTDGVLAHIHSEAEDIKQRAKHEMDQHTFRVVDIKHNLEITIDEEKSPPQAEASFNVEVQGNFYNGRIPDGRGIVWVVLQFQKDKDEMWRITHYRYERATEGMFKRPN